MRDACFMWENSEGTAGIRTRFWVDHPEHESLSSQSSLSRLHETFALKLHVKLHLISRSNSAKHIRSQCPRTATFFLPQSSIDLISRLITISYPNFQPLTNINDNHLPSNILLNDLQTINSITRYLILQLLIV